MSARGHGFFKVLFFEKRKNHILLSKCLNFFHFSDIKVRQRKEKRRSKDLQEYKDPNIYTEYWRKFERGKESGDMNHPFDIGIIDDIFEDEYDQGTMIRVR